MLRQKDRHLRLPHRQKLAFEPPNRLLFSPRRLDETGRQEMSYRNPEVPKAAAAAHAAEVIRVVEEQYRRKC